MVSSTTSSLPSPPQTGRQAQDTARQESPRGLWSQLLAVFRDLSGAFDPFANDADPQVRALGRAALMRHEPRAADYFALGDLCARLTPAGQELNQTYAAKTIAAYSRAGELDVSEQREARAALLAFADWVTGVALQIGTYEPLSVGLLVCERVRQLNVAPSPSTDADRLQRIESELREQIARIFENEQGNTQGEQIAAERESRMVCDQGQMLLRQNQAVDALACFERSIQADARNSAAWLWRAMALTDLGRFNDALMSYDRALELDPQSAGMWNSKGALLLELGRLEPALDCFDHALELATPISTVQAVYWLNKGKSLYMLQRYPEALEALAKSNELDPSAESAAGVAACKEQLEASN